MQSLRNSVFLLASCFVAVCLSDTAVGQVLTITDNAQPANTIATTASPAGTLTYNVAVGGSTNQTLTVSSSVATSVTYVVNQDPTTHQVPSWLRLNGTTGQFFPQVNPSAFLNVNVNAQGLAQGTVTGTFTVYAKGPTIDPITITVTLNVGGASVFSANPSSMQFSAVQGATTASPTQQTLVINSSTNTYNYNLSVVSTGNWLLANPTVGITGQTQIQVSTNPTGLNVGTYTGSITAQSVTSGDSVTVMVTLTVGSQTSSAITVTPTNPSPFVYQLNGLLPQAQTLTVSTTSTTPVQFTVNPNVSWLVPNTLSGSTVAGAPAIIQVSVQTSGFGVGTQNAILTIIPTGGSAFIQVPYQLIVTNNPVLTLTPNTMTFAAPFAGQNPTSQTAQVSLLGNGSSINFTVGSNVSWLSASADKNFVTPGNPANLVVSVNQGNLAVGNYSGTLTITPNTSDNYVLTINVSLSVGTSSQITAGPASLLFSFQTTRVPPAQQQVQIQTNGPSTSFTAIPTTSNCNSTWLNVTSSSSTTPATLTVGVSAAGLPAGTCTGSITVTPTSGSPFSIPVTLVVSANQLLTVNPSLGFGALNAQVGSSPAQQQITINSTDNLAAPFTLTPDQSWLAVTGGQTSPQNITVFYNTASFNPGVYGGNLTVSSVALCPTTSATPCNFVIPVKLVITPNVTVNVTPSSLSFTMTQGGAVPAAQNLTLSNSGSGSPTFIANVDSTCTNLLSVTPSSGLANQAIAVSVLANSANIGTFNCQIALTYQNSATAAANIPVTLTITQARTLNIPTTPLVFNYQLTQAQPVAQKITFTSTGGTVQFNVGTTSSGWLSTDTTVGNTPQDVNVRVNTSGLTVAQSPYSGTITITAPGILTNAVTIPVTLNVTAAPLPLPITILSTASNQAGNISPGGLITIKGTLLGPANPPNGTLFTLNSQGKIDPILAGTRVLFDGNPGTPIFVSANQINVFVPYEIAGRLSTNITVEYQGNTSAPIQVRVNDVAPAIFTLNQQGFGQAAAVNQNGTFNGPSGGNTIPAAINSVIAVYVTGCGQTNPASSTGGVAPTNQLLRVPLPGGFAAATIGGLTSTVEFAGAAPGLANGVCQFNLRVPTPPVGQSLSGNQPIAITINGNSSPAGPTVAIQ